MVLAEAFTGIKLSRFTNEAPSGPRKASGVRHLRGLGAARPSPRRDRSKGSGLLSPRSFSFTGPPSMASSNKSPSEEGQNEQSLLEPGPNNKNSHKVCLPVGLPVRGERSDVNENGSSAEEATNTSNAGSCVKWKIYLLSCIRKCALTLFARKGPILTYGTEVWDISLGSIPGVTWGLPRRRGATGGCLCDPGWICPRGGAAVFFRNREMS